MATRAVVIALVCVAACRGGSGGTEAGTGSGTGAGSDAGTGSGAASGADSDAGTGSGAASGADAGSGPVAIAPSSRCAGLPAGGTVVALPTHGETSTFYVRTDADHRWLAFDRPSGCTVLRIGRADARARGRFWPGLDDVKAFTLRVTDGCRDDVPGTCLAYVAVRDDAGTMLDAIPTCDADEAVSLFAARVFDDADSLLVSCVQLTGFGVWQRLALVHAVDGRLRVVLETRGGWGDHGHGECASCDQRCWVLLDSARWTVRERGAAPVLDTLAPTDYFERAEEVPEARRAPNALRWRWAADRQRFVVERERVESTIAIPDVCAPYPFESPLAR